MIRQDYIIRMIQEIFAAIANLILRRKHISKSDWEEYESTARQVLEVTPQQLEEMDGQTILEKYSQDLASKPRWLVFNKIDLMDKAEAEEKAKAIAEALGWEGKYYLISAASQLGVKDLCWDVMTFIIENPVVQAEEAKQPEKVEFMWDDYHRQQLDEVAAEAEEDDEDWDDDWDEDDEEGVEFIYKH